ncbi:hypothetical protein BKE38_01965 [Pseudoroseomonas deserti]|uniref:Uncharacterized protein n=1 Tax=Teichococcus deserti TaxID=1817963 RepID=A0A1V2H817_9PROT|nr:hypothetical protein [Pseudoroseomonas deserti]ONG58822.1 hypothetical protein BKE38_01965 [Pseudoroseomonas deserti]
MERLEQRAGLLIRQEIARDRAERQAQQLQRAQQLSRGDQAAGMGRRAAQEGLEAVRDRGAEGRAMRARPAAVVTLPGEAEDVRRMLDSNPLTVLDLTARQMEAAQVLASTYRDARPAMEMPRGYGNGHRGGLRHLSHDEYLAAQRAWQDYRNWLEVVVKRLGPQHAASVRDAVVLQEPAPAWRVRQALDTLAAYWKLP